MSLAQRSLLTLIVAGSLVGVAYGQRGDTKEFKGSDEEMQAKGAQEVACKLVRVKKMPQPSEGVLRGIKASREMQAVFEVGRDGQVSLNKDYVLFECEAQAIFVAAPATNMDVEIMKSETSPVLTHENLKWIPRGGWVVFQCLCGDIVLGPGESHFSLSDTCRFKRDSDGKPIWGACEGYCEGSTCKSSSYGVDSDGSQFRVN